ADELLPPARTHRPVVSAGRPMPVHRRRALRLRVPHLHRRNPHRPRPRPRCLPRPHPRRMRDRMTTPYYSDDSVTLYHGDALDILPTIAAGSVDLCVTDPPYVIGAVSAGSIGSKS